MFGDNSSEANVASDRMPGAIILPGVAAAEMLGSVAVAGALVEAGVAVRSAAACPASAASWWSALTAAFLSPRSGFGCTLSVGAAASASRC